MRIISAIILSAVFLLIAGSAASQILAPITGGGATCCTYYVDQTGGSDSNSGRTPALAWKTISKVNGTTLAAGQSVGFKRGETWQGTTLAVSHSGSAGSRIVFDAYGTGAQPIIRGDASVSSWTSESVTTPVTVTASTAAATDSGFMAFGSFHTGGGYVDVGDGLGPAGLRFPSVAVPAGATVTAATIVDSEAAGSGTDTTNITIAGQKSSDSAAFSTVGDWNTRYANKTTALVAWNSVPLVAAGSTYTTPSIASIVQEIAAVSGWASGNAMTIFLSNNSSSSGSYRMPSGYGGFYSAPVLSVTYSSAGFTAYYAAAASKPLQVMFDGARLASVAAKGSLATGKWFWDSVNSRIYIFDNPSGHSVAHSLVDDVQITASYITLSHLTLEYGNYGVAGGDDFTGTGVVGLAEVTIDHCTIQHNASSGVWIGSKMTEVSTPATKLIVSNNTVSDNGNFGIKFAGYMTGGVISDNTVTANGMLYDPTIYVTGWHGITVLGNQTDKGPQGTLITRNNVTLQHGLLAALPYFEGAGIQSDNNAVGTVIANNTSCTNQGPGIISHSKNTTIYYNVVCGNGTANQDIAASGIIVSEYAGTSVYHNTIYGSVQSGILTYSSPGVTTIKNNILMDNGTYEIDVASGTTLTSDYNLVYHSGGGSYMKWQGTASTWATWQGHSVDANSLITNPLFTNAAAGDFTIPTNSPAYNAGTYIVGVSTKNPPNIGSK